MTPTPSKRQKARRIRREARVRRGPGARARVWLWAGLAAAVAIAAAVVWWPAPDPIGGLIATLEEAPLVVTEREAPPPPSHEVPVVHEAAIARALSRVAPPRAVEPPPAWQRYAVPVAPSDGRPRIAIVIDDLGLSAARSRRVAALPAPLTLAILPYGRAAVAMAREFRARGHEVLVHLPMQPGRASADPGPQALTVDLDDAELARRIAWNLDRFGGYVGANNHMGSRFTRDPAGMLTVIAELKRRGLLFLDSRTTPATVGALVAERLGVPGLERDFFLDSEGPTSDVAAVLRQVEQRARRTGRAIAIGHPFPVTLQALRLWLPAARAAGFQIVPISALITPPPAAAVSGAPGGGDDGTTAARLD